MSKLKERIGLRLHSKDLTVLKKICEARGENPSVFARRAIKKELALFSYLSPEEKKALGIPTEEEGIQR